MTESEFNALVDDTLMAIEEVLDEAESDLDPETSGGVLTVRCENGSQVIFTRQVPVRQLWVAAVSGGFHFDYDGAEGQWVRDSDGRKLGPFLEQVFAEQAGETFTFDL
ncbi:iron donor protein CyaY [Motiliproteus sp. SC1-56]|uniref:iron donor protein CyaY n=1 Tax=Motiliproteus sp. SC1-56 TaxID=2799565 RepID=UPI001A8CF61B|nr:iron donor protein CyaY [Motiliproteus sp. SC1-56]